ncbi:MAG TPA: hypothetical protein VKJ01_23275 [Candidatus Solibacter sp.]|nr:hypothetical protein [Candidatus Solibacter sp.]
MFPYDSDGVDVSLIRWMLSLTPAERLATLQEFVDFVAEVRSRNAEEPILRGLSDAHELPG